ncbi:Gfo/Idh/MocA family oxidoreductase [bacterium]|nr:Gfo/Idh/MocA family oxidoreductase [bacterium]
MKFLICGLGSIGLRHLRNIRELGYNDIILFRSGKSVVPGLTEAEGLRCYSSIDEALAESPDICVISNPTSMHVATAVKAANSGCHLFIEKPLSNNLEGVDELSSLVERNNLISLVTYQFRYHPHIKILKKLISEDNKYGNAVYASAEWSEYLPDWHPWEDYRLGYSARLDLGGGVLMTQIHPLNYLNYIFGDISSLQVKKHSTNTLGIEADDVADIIISFRVGVLGHVHVDYLQKPRVHTLKIVTEKGRFEWDCHQNALQFIYMNGETDEFSNHGFRRNDMFLEMLRDFVQSVICKTSTVFSVADAVTELSLLSASE